MPPNRRMHRVGDLLQEVASDVLRHVKDPAVDGALITITSVQVSADMSQAKFYVTVMNRPVGEVVEALNRASGFIRREITRQVNMKRVPAVQFVFDDTLEQGMRVQQLLHQVAQQPRSEERESAQEDS